MLAHAQRERPGGRAGWRADQRRHAQDAPVDFSQPAAARGACGSLPVTEFRIAAGAQQIICLAGVIMTLPGPPADPNAFQIDLAPDGRVVGLL